MLALLILHPNDGKSGATSITAKRKRLRFEIRASGRIPIRKPRSNRTKTQARTSQSIGGKKNTNCREQAVVQRKWTAKALPMARSEPQRAKRRSFFPIVCEPESEQGPISRRNLECKILCQGFRGHEPPNRPNREARRKKDVATDAIATAVLDPLSVYIHSLIRVLSANVYIEV